MTCSVEFYTVAQKLLMLLYVLDDSEKKGRKAEKMLKIYRWQVDKHIFFLGHQSTSGKEI